MTLAIKFHNFHRWTAVSIDGQPSGYMRTEDSGMTALHISRHAPAWLIAARVAGPYFSRDAAQDAILHGAEEYSAQGDIFANENIPPSQPKEMH